MHSKFFNPAFNSAIFDGPVRIYFAQFHESLALKIYFSLQQKHPELLQKAKSMHQKTGKNILVMLYPSQESFEMSFDATGIFLATEQLSNDDIIGVNGPFEDEQITTVLGAVESCLLNWVDNEEINHSSLQI